MFFICPPEFRKHTFRGLTHELCFQEFKDVSHVGIYCSDKGSCIASCIFYRQTNENRHNQPTNQSPRTLPKMKVQNFIICTYVHGVMESCLDPEKGGSARGAVDEGISSDAWATGSRSLYVTIFHSYRALSLRSPGFQNCCGIYLFFFNS